MKDLFKSYHRKKVLTNLWILSLSAIFAVSINMTLLGWQTWENLKANVLEISEQDVSMPNFIAQNDGEKVIFSTSWILQNVSSISFSLAYNPEILELQESISPLVGSQIAAIENDEGYINYMINISENITIDEGSQLLTIPYERVWSGTIHMNVVNANFSDSAENVFFLSSEGIMF